MSATAAALAAPLFAGGASALQPMQTRRALAVAARGGRAFLTENGRAGTFVWQGGDHSQGVTADPRQGVYIAAAIDPSGRTGAWIREREGSLRVSWFGALGDGVTNDTRALAAASAFVEFEGGGTLEFERATYLIGVQAERSVSAEWAFEPMPVIDIEGCRGKVALRGNDAVLRCAPALRFGSFERATSRPAAVVHPFYDRGLRATPYQAAIRLQNNHGGVEVSGFEIDGQITQAVIGGGWGDIGWQVPHTGLWIYDNRGPHLISDIHAHHHGLDGMVLFNRIRSETDPPVPVRVERFRSEYNGRQGISLIGGRGVTFVDCRLSHTGRNGVVASNPGAGLDIEAENSLIRDVEIIGCVFDDNHGQGIVADTGDSARLSFSRCKFVGTTSHAAWPHKPFIRFQDCEFVGPITRCFEDPGGSPAATQFINCYFNDHPERSSTGRVTSGRIDLGGSGGGTLFEKCRFDYRHDMQLPYSPETVRYRDCSMRQQSPETAYPTGTYSGINEIWGPVDLGRSIIRGTVVLNGKRHS